MGFFVAETCNNHLTEAFRHQLQHMLRVRLKRNKTRFIFSHDKVTWPPVLGDFYRLRNAFQLWSNWEVVKLNTFPLWIWWRWWQYICSQNGVCVLCPRVSVIYNIIHGFIVRSRLTEDSTPLCADIERLLQTVGPLLLYFFWTFSCSLGVYLYIFFSSSNFTQNISSGREREREKIGSSSTVLTFNPVMHFKLISSLVKCHYTVTHSRGWIWVVAGRASAAGPFP